MKYMVVVEKGESSYGVHVPDLPGCIAAAATLDETRRLIREARRRHRALRPCAAAPRMAGIRTLDLR